MTSEARIQMLLEDSEAHVPVEGKQFFALESLNFFEKPRWITLTEFLSYYPEYKGRPQNYYIEALCFIKISDPVVPAEGSEKGAPAILCTARLSNGALHTAMSRPLMRSEYRTDTGLALVVDKIYHAVGEAMAAVAIEIDQPDMFLKAALHVKRMDL